MLRLHSCWSFKNGYTNNKRFTNRVTRSALEIQNPHFYERHSHFWAERRRSDFVSFSTDRVTRLVNPFGFDILLSNVHGRPNPTSYPASVPCMNHPLPKNQTFSGLGRNPSQYIRNSTHLDVSGNVIEGLFDPHKRAHKAYYKLKHHLGHTFYQNPRLSLKLFDRLVKPILLYCSRTFVDALNTVTAQNNPI